MAETKPRVMDLVRKELVKDPSISSEALYQKAKKTDRSIGSLSIRQFHARYPLQVKRISAAARKRRAGAGRKGAAPKTAARKTAARKTRKVGRPRGPARKQSRGSTTGGAAPAAMSARSSAGTDSRSAVRSILLEFAREVAAAEGKADVIGVVGRVDTWVDRVQKASA